MGLLLDVSAHPTAIKARYEHVRDCTILQCFVHGSTTRTLSPIPPCCRRASLHPPSLPTASPLRSPFAMGSATMHEDMPTPPGCRPWQQVRADDLRRQWTASGRPLDVVSTIPSARDVPRSLLPQQALSTATPWASGSPVVHTRGLASPQGSCRQGPLGEVDLPIHRLQGDPGYLANAPTLRIEYESPCQGSSGGSECGLPSLSGDLMDVLQYCNSCTDSIEVENLYLRVPPDQLSQHPHVLAAILQKIVPLASLCMEVSPEDLVSLKSAFVSA